MNRISLREAQTIMNAAFEKGAELGAARLAVAVLDPGGHLIAFARQDGAPIARFHVAFRKAAGALAVGVSSRRIAEMAARSPTFLPGLLAYAPGGAIAAAGGVIAMRGDEPIGAVGVTGSNPDDDEAMALHGLSVANLQPL